MNLNDQSHLYFIFDLTLLPLRFHNNKSHVRRGNERDPGVEELQRHLATATTNISTPFGKGLAIRLDPNNRADCSASVTNVHFVKQELPNSQLCIGTVTNV
jgi:hypothetical protein